MNLPDGTPIEPGKHYITRDGSRARVYAVDATKDSPYSIHGALLSKCGRDWIPETWRSDGKCCGAGHGRDLVGPWIDKPVVDWSVIPPWLSAVVYSPRHEKWVAFIKSPSPSDKGWYGGGWENALLIPPDYAPKWTGDWKLSLVERPQ